ncbi:hypothetical protein BS50DRAFT_110686 [Corynespora cassiicola Philippines]|uniref:Uncharacterized protein n=1 Tax=Corynespora cassiicola Philippines TaxID=1448308 RepID=A0A2T2NDC0_CORCC|nr:hypothetical protein BS50DRAFT_110686 [Corynespora cassiicola Philippines]
MFRFDLIIPAECHVSVSNTGPDKNAWRWLGNHATMTRLTAPNRASNPATQPALYPASPEGKKTQVSPCTPPHHMGISTPEATKTTTNEREKKKERTIGRTRQRLATLFHAAGLVTLCTKKLARGEKNRWACDGDVVDDDDDFPKLSFPRLAKLV